MGVPNNCRGRLMTAEGIENPNNVTGTFFNAVHLLPEDLRFEHGAPNLLI